MRAVNATLLFFACLLASGLPALSAPKVVASIRPVHSLVAAVMEDVGMPELVISGNASPHGHALKPSQAQMLADAKIVFWIGPGLETFMVKPIETIAKDAISAELIDAPGIVKLEPRELDHDEDHEGEHEAKHDEDHDEKHDARHDHDEKHEEDHAKHDHDEQHDDHSKEHDEHAGHDHGELDPHVWLDPLNAAAMTDHIADVLAKADPANASRYRANAEELSERLKTLTDDLRYQLEPVHDRRFIVFHDALQYFEHRFNLAQPAAITISPEISPGVRRIEEIRALAGESDVVCIFAEPQFEQDVIKAIAKETGLTVATMDPLGSSIPAGPELYGAMLQSIASTIRDCQAER